jgi:hypothetical protein
MMGSFAGTAFLVGLLLSILTGHWYLIFVGLGLSAFVGSLSANNGHAAAGGFQGLAFFLGLAIIAATNWWWPGIAFVLIICAILGTLHVPLANYFSGMLGTNQPYQQSQQPYYQPPQPQQPQQPYYQPSQSEQQPYQPYQEGYQPDSQPGTYQEGGQQHQYPPASQPNYERPQAQYPPQEMPPQGQ